MTEQTQTPPATTTEQTTPPPESPPATYIDDPAKTPEQNAAAKADFEKAAADKAAADKAAADKKAADDAEAAKLDTKKNPFDVKEIKLPDGLAIDEGTAKSFTEIVNKYGIPRDAAAALVDLQSNAMKAFSEKDSGAWEKTQAEWETAAKADADYGGAKFEESDAAIGALINQYGSDELRQALDVTGAGSHPAMFRFFAKMAAELKEGKALAGTPAGDALRDHASILYPNQGKT